MFIVDMLKGHLSSVGAAQTHAAPTGLDILACRITINMALLTELKTGPQVALRKIDETKLILILTVPRGCSYIPGGIPM